MPRLFGRQATLPQARPCDPESVIIRSACAIAIFLFQVDNIAPPAIDQGSVVNAASLIPGSLASGSLARGSRFRLHGLRFGPGAAVSIEQNGHSTAAQVLSADTETLEALLSPATPTGESNLIVSFEGRRSRPYPLRIVDSSFGIFSANRQGWGPAIPPTPIHPGQSVVLTGTGAGVQPHNVLVTVGGVSAIKFSVDPGTTGLDRLTFTIPMNSPAGCWVPIQAEIDGISSNVVTLPITHENEPCATNDPWFAKSKPRGRSAWIVLMRSKILLELLPGKRVDFTIDSALAGFNNALAAPLDPTPFELIPPIGACAMYATRVDAQSFLLPSLVRQTVSGRDLNLGPKVATETKMIPDLDAGPAFLVSGPRGRQSVERSIHPPRVYTAVLGGNPPFTRIQPKPLFLSPGTYVAHIAGGADISAFDSRIKVQPPIEWTNEKEMTSLDRKSGFTVRWRVHDKSSVVPILAVNVDRTNSTVGVCVCLAKGSAGSFRIPARMLANLPVTAEAGTDLSLGFVAIGSAPANQPAPIQTPSIDSGYAAFVSMAGRSVPIR